MREKELRLALICYGGVSLAIYMHGITREIWHLVRASRQFHQNDTQISGIEQIYLQLLSAIENRGNIKMRVLADIVAGSSAGGINAVFLSQAIVTGQSLEPLTDLWLQNADVETLIDPDARPFSRFTKFWAIPIAWALLRRKGGAVERMVSVEARSEVAAKLSKFVRARWFRPPFGGAGFSQLLFDAFDAMANTRSGPGLLPNNQPLDLFVTVTDFDGHDEALRLNSPPQVTETEHRITLSFSNQAGPANYLAEIPELVLAARSTASFPGAFPAFSVRELDDVIKARKANWAGRDAFLKRILPQQYEAGTAADTILIDGSILANAPFNQAIEALRNRPAKREIDRRFVYIDPTPGYPVVRTQRKASEEDRRKPPGWLSVILGATSNIPREQPIRDSLDKIQGRTERILRMQTVIKSLDVDIERSIEAMLGKTWFLSKPTPERIERWRATANKKAAAAAGYSYPAYAHLKIVGVVEDIIASAWRAASESNYGHFQKLREAIWGEFRRRGLDALSGDKGIGATDRSVQFFREHDIRFRIRRLRFLVRRWVDGQEPGEPLHGQHNLPELAAMHDSIYKCLAMYLERETSGWMGRDFTAIVETGIVNPAAIIDILAVKRDLITIDRAVDKRLCEAIAALKPDAQRYMLLGYLGYPLYDIATLPLLQGEGFDEFDPVKVDRISPDDANAIRGGGAGTTLKGIEFNNFGAFFSRAYRENDYLWGRLHGVDRLIDIVISAIPTDGVFGPAEINSFKKKSFHAILDEEERRLTKIAPLIASLRREIDAITE